MTTFQEQVIRDELTRLKLEESIAGRKFSVDKYVEIREKELQSDTNIPITYICCDMLEKSLGDHNGLYSQTIGAKDSNKIDSIIMYVGGEYTHKKGAAIIQYCPFCGKPRIRASQAG